MAVLPGVLGCRPLRRTVQLRLGANTLWLPGGTTIFFALAALRSVPQAGSQFHGLATAIREISGLAPFKLSRVNETVGGSVLETWVTERAANLKTSNPLFTVDCPVPQPLYPWTGNATSGGS